MRVVIQDQNVTFEGDKGEVVFMTTEQLLEMVRILNTVILEGDRFFFKSLEFTV
ncbi:hypothetical protein ES702_02945 [subsurface metagenome]